jgi:transaldolase
MGISGPDPGGRRARRVSPEVSPDAVTGAYDDAAQVLAALAAAGIDYDDVVQTLEREGISKFADAWSRLLDRLRSVLAKGAIS